MYEASATNSLTDGGRLHRCQTQNAALPDVMRTFWADPDATSGIEWVRRRRSQVGS